MFRRDLLYFFSFSFSTSQSAKRLKKLLEKKKRTKSASIERKWLNWMKLNGRREKERRRLRKGRRTRIKEDWGIVTWIETETDLGHQAEVTEVRR